MKDVSIALTLLAKLRINASDREAEKAGYLNAIYNISLNQSLAKYRGAAQRIPNRIVKAMSKQSSFLFQRALLSAESDFSVQLMIERHTGQAVFLQVAAFARLLRVMRGGGGTGQLVRGILLEHITESADTLYVSHKVILLAKSSALLLCITQLICTPSNAISRRSSSA